MKQEAESEEERERKIIKAQKSKLKKQAAALIAEQAKLCFKSGLNNFTKNLYSRKVDELNVALTHALQLK